MSGTVLPFFGEIKAVFLRERGNHHYGPGAYALASFVTAVPAVFVIALASCAIMYFAIGFQSGGFLTFLLVMYLSLLVAEGCVYMAGCVARLAGGCGSCGLHVSHARATVSSSPQRAGPCGPHRCVRLFLPRARLGIPMLIAAASLPPRRTGIAGCAFLYGAYMLVEGLFKM